VDGASELDLGVRGWVMRQGPPRRASYARRDGTMRSSGSKLRAWIGGLRRRRYRARRAHGEQAAGKLGGRLRVAASRCRVRVYRESELRRRPSCRYNRPLNGSVGHAAFLAETAVSRREVSRSISEIDRLRLAPSQRTVGHPDCNVVSAVVARASANVLIIPQRPHRGLLRIRAVQIAKWPAC
jgi:hypothetical protein